MLKGSKKLFLLACVVVPFLAYSFYYYSMVFKNAPYKFTEFQSFVFKYGKGDSLVNHYDSKTGDYQYTTKNGLLVKKKLKLSQNELLYLHRKAAELGFWDFPSTELRSDTLTKGKSPHYYMEFNYKRKSKKVLFDAAYDGDSRLVDANERMVKEIQKVLDEAETNQSK